MSGNSKLVMDLGIPPLEIKRAFESNPLKSISLVCGLAVIMRCSHQACQRYQAVDPSDAMSAVNPMTTKGNASWAEAGLVCCFGWHCLSNATCLIRQHLLSLLIIVSRITMLCQSIRHLKIICIRQVVLDKWFPLIVCGLPGSGSDAEQWVAVAVLKQWCLRRGALRFLSTTMC